MLVVLPPLRCSKLPREIFFAPRARPGLGRPLRLRAAVLSRLVPQVSWQPRFQVARLRIGRATTESGSRISLMPSAMRNSVSFGGISRRQTYSRSKGARQRRGEMAIDSIKSVAVLGAGTMGNGIAQVFARAGYQVILRDVEQRFLDRALETIAKNLDREI